VLYVDTSALLKRYLDEPERDRCEHHLLADPDWVTARHTLIEVRRNLARLLDDGPLRQALDLFARDWDRCAVVELDAITCDRAAEIAEATGARTLDAMHLAAAMRVGGGLGFLTFDLRQAVAARALGLAVLWT
jgi:predicted nucleic acid-binding protein